MHVQVDQANSQADALIVHSPWYRLAYTLSIRHHQFVDPLVALLDVCHSGLVPGVHGHYVHASPLTLRHVAGG